jgi:hypothetical protein
MFDVFYSGIKPNLFVHEYEADSIEHAQTLSRTRYFWWITYLADYSTHDWNFQPVPWQSEYTHTWPSQHHEYSGTYLVPRSGEIKYHFHKKIIPNRDTTADFDTLVDNTEFDFTWAPHPHDPPYTYVFGNQWWPANRMPTIEYHVPGATERKYMDTPQARLLATHNNCWHTLADCEWDYSWVPDPGDPPLIYVFGNQWWPANRMPTVEYHVPGAVERKYMSWPRATLLPTASNWTVPTGLTDVDLSWCPDPGDPPMTYQFGTQWQRTGGPVYTVPGTTEVKYVSLPRAVKASKDTAWSVPSGVDTSTFDWTWHPDATEPPYVYQFGTQHQRTGGPRYTMPGATEVKYVDQIRIKTVANAAVIYEIDHLDGNVGQIPNTAKRVRYFDNYRDTLVRLAKSIGTEHEFVWVCSSICDYTNFDFSWHPEQWQATMLHVFASDEQKFGDTFYMHVPTFAESAEHRALLEWYDCNFVDTIVPRRRMPVIEHAGDSNVDAVKTTEWAGPVALFTTNGEPMTIPAVNLWRSETKTITPLSSGASAVVVPKSAVPYIKTQMYDYPYIDKTQQRCHGDTKLDIVFISNGETNAEDNWTMLESRIIGLETNKLHRVDRVNGRAAAYHAAAEASTTPWFFAVFGKLAIDLDFDWAWQPDRMQEAKHYIFHARNPVNGLVYGHQAMIAYNKQLVLDNPGVGLDFTLDSPHEVVPILSGVAYYDTSAWSTWRTAFREVLKLQASLPDVENEYRLNKWLDINSDETDPQWSRLGAEDAVEYYNQVNGDFAALKKSYEWEWLATYAFVKRSLLPSQ